MSDDPSASKPVRPDFSSIDRIVASSIGAQHLPGAVVAIGHGGEIAFLQAYGMRAVSPASEPMTTDTIFDMASLTKPTITALAVMQLWERTYFQLDEPVSRFLPTFARNGKGAVTIRDLLTHYSGLPPDLPLVPDWSGKDRAIALAMAARLDHPPGIRFVYSDINYIVLGLLVERLAGEPLDRYADRFILAPLDMTQSKFLPMSRLSPALRDRIAPTQWIWPAAGPAPEMLRGVVHDPTSRRMGGVAGHAGLFSCARDMSHYAQSLLDRLAGRCSAFPLRQDTLRLMTSPQQPPLENDRRRTSDLRGLGWDIDTHYSSPRGHFFPLGSFGHTGFTGTSLWLDPASGTFVLVLTSRVHPDGASHGIIPLRRDLADAAARALGIGGPVVRHAAG